MPTCRALTPPTDAMSAAAVAAYESMADPDDYAAEADQEYAERAAAEAMAEATELQRFRDAAGIVAPDECSWPSEADVQSYLDEVAASDDEEWERFRSRTYPTPEEMDAYHAGTPTAAEVAAGFAAAGEADPFN